MYLKLREERNLTRTEVVAACPSIRSVAILQAIEESQFTPNNIVLLDMARIYDVSLIQIKRGKPKSVFSHHVCPGARLKAAREITKTSLKEVAEQISVPVKQIVDYERGSSFVEYEDLVAMSRLFGVCSSLLVFNVRN